MRTIVQSRWVAVLRAAALMLGVPSLACAGPLDPPPGPIAPTPGPEPRIAVNATNTPGDADSLFKITQPGSYYLNGNITGEAGKHGIEIAASGVTLDLNGFDLAGIPAMGNFDGVRNSTAGLVSIAVLNGSVRNWGGQGVNISFSGVTNCRIADILASGNSGIGIFTGTACTITNCSVSNNTSNGISTGATCRVSNCVASNNAGSGITIGIGSSISDCAARSNTLDGIRCVSACLVLANNCASNGTNGDGAGIHATGSDNRIEGNNCTSADRGIEVDAAGNIIIRNTCSGNATNWELAPNNEFGAIIDATGTSASGVSGDSAGSSMPTTDPSANYTY